MAARHARHLFGGALGHDLPAAIAALGADIDQVIGGFDHVEIMLDHHHRVALIHQLVKHLKQLAHILKMQPRGGLIQNVKRAPRGPARKLLGQLHALGLAARKRGGLLAHLHIAQTHAHQRIHLFADRGHGLEKALRIFNSHIKNIGYALAFEANFKRFAVVAGAFAGFAFHVNIGQKVHLNLDHAIALAGLAAPALHVE